MEQWLRQYYQRITLSLQLCCDLPGAGDEVSDERIGIRNFDFGTIGYRRPHYRGAQVFPGKCCRTRVHPFR